MSKVQLSNAFYFTLTDGDEVWPCTVDGSYRLSFGGNEHNVRGAGEKDVSETEMIDGVLNDGRVSRFRSKTNPSRSKNPNHFFAASPSVRAIYVNVSGVYVRLK